nr:hypothetical protein [Tanacetum cinerariifolium]
DYSRPNHIPTLSQITHTTISTVYFFDQTLHAMVLVDHTGWKLRRRQWTGTTEQLIEQLESTYDNAPNMFSIRIHHGGKFQRYPGRMYVSGRVDIFDMIVALNMMVLKLGYTEHGVTVLDSYLRASRFKATLEDITDVPAELDREAVFADVAGSGVDSSGFSHDESFGVDDLDLNLNEPRLALKNPLWQRLALKNQLWKRLALRHPLWKRWGNVKQGNGHEDESAPTDGQFFYDDEGINTAYETEYDVQSSEDAGTDDDDDDDVDEDFLVDEENEIVDPDVDVYLFGISMDIPFDNIGITNLVPNVVLEGEDVNVINVNGFDSDPANDEERNYKKRRAKAKAEREIRGDHVLQYSMIRDYVVKLQSTIPNTTVKIVVERNIDPSLPTMGPFPGQVLVEVGLYSNNRIYPLAYALVEAKTKSSWCQFLQCLGDDIDLHPNSNFIFISDRQKQGWCGQTYKDLLWRAASATNVRDFEKCILELKTMNPKAHEWLNKIPAEHWARSHFSGRAKYDLLLNNIYEVFNGKIVGGRNKPMITLLEYIKEYCMKRIMNIQGVIDKCTGPLTYTSTRIMESIKKEAHLMKVQWNGANKYQVSSSLGDQCVVDVVSLSATGGKGGVGVPGGASVSSQGSSHTRWTKRRVKTEIISPQKRTPTQPSSQPSTSSKMPVSQTSNAYGKEI